MTHDRSYAWPITVAHDRVLNFQTPGSRPEPLLESCYVSFAAVNHARNNSSSRWKCLSMHAFEGLCVKTFCWAGVLRIKFALRLTKCTHDAIMILWLWHQAPIHFMLSAPVFFLFFHECLNEDLKLVPPLVFIIFRPRRHVMSRIRVIQTSIIAIYLNCCNDCTLWPNNGDVALKTLWCGRMCWKGTVFPPWIEYHVSNFNTPLHVRELNSQMRIGIGLWLAIGSCIASCSIDKKAKKWNLL